MSTSFLWLLRSTGFVKTTVSVGSFSDIFGDSRSFTVIFSPPLAAANEEIAKTVATVVNFMVGL